mmetsp:Transcript_49214/g.157388  ORF Transcript_49214/g.157388 Transcript_49214/m.157388 type:complete len:237 (-) Transcript_49214:790-1500(-)
MLGGETVHRDMRPRDDQAMLAGVHATLDDACHAVVCTPEPEVVAHNMARADLHHNPGPDLHLMRVVGAAHARKDVLQEARVLGAACMCARSPLQQRVCLAGASLQQHPGDAHAIHVPNAHRCCAPLRHESGEAEAKQHLVVPPQLQRGLQVVDAGRQHHVQALLQVAVDDGSCVCVLGHVDVSEIHRLPQAEIRANAAALHGWHLQAVPPRCVYRQEGLLRDHWRRANTGAGEHAV